MVANSRCRAFLYVILSKNRICCMADLMLNQIVVQIDQKNCAALVGSNLPYLCLTLNLDVWIVRFRPTHGFTTIEIPPEQQTAYN
jgi:hypothetical protein